VCSPVQSAIATLASSGRWRSTARVGCVPVDQAVGHSRVFGRYGHTRDSSAWALTWEFPASRGVRRNPRQARCPAVVASRTLAPAAHRRFHHAEPLKLWAAVFRPGPSPLGTSPFIHFGRFGRPQSSRTTSPNGYIDAFMVYDERVTKAQKSVQHGLSRIGTSLHGRTLRWKDCNALRSRCHTQRLNQE
jgi:hypothetical protein